MPGGMPFRLNPYEQSSMQNLAQALAHGLDPNLAMQVYDQTIQGATARRTQNLDARQQGLMGLRDTAMQLATQGAAPGAVQNAIGGMAGDLPLMNGPRGENKMGNLQEFVGGLYPQGSKISGLVPADQRLALQEQMGTQVNGLDQEDTAAIGGLVMQGLQAGTPFFDIREQVKQTSYAAGMTPDEVNAAIMAAEHAYEGATGTSLDDMRGVADKLRSYAGSDSIDQIGDIGSDDSRLGGFADSFVADYKKDQDNPDIVQQLVGQAMSDPRQRSQLMQLAQQLGMSGAGSAGGFSPPTTTMPEQLASLPGYSTGLGGQYTGGAIGAGSDAVAGLVGPALNQQNNPYTNTWTEPDTPWWEDVVNAPRSFMDDILGFLGG